MDLLAITAQLSVQDGVALDEAAVPGLLAQPAPPKAARGRERDFLFAHLSLSGVREETADLARQLAEGLGKRFFAAAGSVTSALRRAVLETNEQLLRHNLTTKKSHEGALSCAVLHGGELYTLQVGEGLAFLGHNFGVERLPARPAQHLTPLGRSAGIDIRFAYHQLQNGDMMLLADPRLGHLSGAALASVLVDTEIESGLDALMTVVSSDTARLLLVEFADELPSTLPLKFQHSKKPAAKAAAPKAPAPARAEPQAAAVATAVAARPIRATGSSLLEAATPATPEAVSPVETSARRVASTSARGLSRFTAWLAAVLGRLRGRVSAEPAGLSIHWAIPATIALIVPLLVGAVVTSVYLQRDNVATLSVVKQQMLDEMVAAENAAADTAQAQTHYLAVLALADEADTLRPDDPDVGAMRTEARLALDRLEGVSRTTAERFYQFETGASLTRIALRGVDGGLAVLDEAANRVAYLPTDETYSALTTEEPPIIAFGGQSVGALSIGTLFDLIWLPGIASETRDSITMIDRGGGLFHYYPNLGDIGGATLANSSAWLNPLAVADYLDRLYVLDSEAQQIWKYYATDGFTQFPGDEAIAFSANMGLEGAVDFDLYTEDGSLVLLYADGRIRYYDTRSGRVHWDETDLLAAGLTTPFVAPTTVKLVGSGLNASIFVLDPGSGRLVQLSRGGVVLNQYRIMDENGIDIISRGSDFAVTDAPQSIFVVAGETIYVTGGN